MAALMGRTELGIREIGSTVDVPEDPKAKLMYYLKCMCSLLDMSDHPNIARLTNFSRYYSLSEEETDTLVLMCVLLSPEELNGKVMFQDDAMCKGSTNQFYEMSAVRSTFLLTGTVLVGGQAKAVSKIMAYKQVWILDNWIIPMVTFTKRLERIARGGKPEAQRTLEYHRSVRSTIPARRPAAQTSQNTTHNTVTTQYPAAQSNQTTRNTVTTTTTNNDDDGCCCTIL